MIGRTIGGLPVWAIALDALGTLTLVAGLLIMFDVLPTGTREAGVALVIIGATLMAPLVLVIVRRATNRG